MSIGTYSIGRRSIANARRTGADAPTTFTPPWISVRFKPTRYTPHKSRVELQTPTSRVELQTP